MIESNFPTAKRPFLPAPLVSRYYPAVAIEEARKRLTTCIQRADGPALLVGPAGAGKSLLCEVLAESFKESMEVVYLTSGGFSTPLALLQAIMHSLELQYARRDEGELRLALADHLSKASSGRRLLLIVDDAESTPPRLLLELRNLTNLAREGKPLVLVVLAGSPELEEVFAGPKLESFNQRLAVRCYLDALDHGETRQYVRAQIAAAGGDPDRIVTDEALDAVHHATSGIPRLINQLCDHALLMADRKQEGRLDALQIETAWADLQQLPTPWQPAHPNRADVPLGGAAESGASDSSVVEFGGLDEREGDEAASYSEMNDLDEIGAEASIPTVPFTSPPRCAPASLDIDSRFAAMENGLANVDADFGKLDDQSGGHLIVAPTTDPFGEMFEEEEIVLDHYASLQASSAQIHRRVHCYESRELARALRAFSASDAKAAKTIPAKSNPPQGVPAKPPAQFDTVEPEDDFVDRDTPTIVLDSEKRRAAKRPATVSPKKADVIRPVEFFDALDVVDPHHEDLIIIDDEPERGSGVVRSSLRIAEFGQLFASLRRE